MFNTGIIGQAKSYISTGTGLLKNPRHILGFSNSSFLKGLSDTTLERMKGRSDPALSCFWDVQMPDVPAFEEQQTTLGMLSSLAGGLSKFSLLGAAAANDAESNTLSSGLIGLGAGLNSASSALSKADSWVNKTLGNPVGNIKLDPEYVEGINLVFPEYQTREVFRGGVMRKYPDASVSLGDLTLTFYVGNDNESYRYIMNWLQLVSTPASQNLPNNVRIWAPPSIYKKTIQVALMDMNSNDVYSIDYYGCWPKSFSDVSLDADGTRLTYDVTFSVDSMCTYGFDYVPFTEELMNIASGAAKKVASAVMGKATEMVTSHLTISPGSTGNTELY